MENLEEHILWELEKEWRNSSPRYSDKELLDIFPEARPYLKTRLEILKKRSEDIHSEILEKLIKVYCHKFEDNFSKWFAEEVVRQIQGEELKDTQKEIKRLSFLLNPPKEVAGKITPAMIQKAKDYPFENLIQFNRNRFTKCFAHTEKTPSLHLQKDKNRIYCFGCSKGWDTIQFVMETKGLNFKQAVLALQ